MGWSRLGAAPTPAQLPPLQDPLLIFEDVKQLDAPKAMANGLHRLERM